MPKSKDKRERKGILTLNKMKKIYDSIPKEDYTIKPWQEPILWFLWLFIGYTTESEGWKFYWVDFKGVRYLLKDKEI